MKEKHYYIPSIEEIMLGLEIEQKFKNTYPSKEFSWSKRIITKYDFNGNRIYGDIFKKIDKEEIRVKYLDKEDIESLGFQITAEYDKYIEFSINNTKFLFNLEYKTLNIEVQPTPNIVTTVFFGIIKNKSELKKLLKQLQIN